MFDVGYHTYRCQHCFLHEVVCFPYLTLGHGLELPSDVGVSLISGKLHEAEALHSSRLRGLGNLLGYDHKDTLDAMWSFAKFFGRHGEYLSCLATRSTNSAPVSLNLLLMCENQYSHVTH